jgi:hypothetical protein
MSGQIAGQNPHTPHLSGVSRIGFGSKLNEDSGLRKLSTNAYFCPDTGSLPVYIKKTTTRIVHAPLFPSGVHRTSADIHS